MASGFKERATLALEATGVPLNTVLSDGIRIEPHGNGFVLRWEGAAMLTPEQAMALVAPDTPAD